MLCLFAFAFFVFSFSFIFLSADLCFLFFIDRLLLASGSNCNIRTCGQPPDLLLPQLCRNFSCFLCSTAALQHCSSSKGALLLFIDALLCAIFVWQLKMQPQQMAMAC